MIRFRCTECGKKLKAEKEIIGRKVKCTRCDNIELVPAAGNLDQPDRPKERLEANKPKPARFKSDRNSGKPKTVNLDQPVELFGHSAIGSADPDSFEPRFNVSRPKTSNYRRILMIGFVGLFVVGAIAVVFNYSWIVKASRMLSTDYEQLEEVIFYRKSVKKLEASRHIMEIAGKAYLAARGGEEDLKELYDYNSSIEQMTTHSDMLEKVESLLRRGKEMEAKALLVNTGVELDQMRKEVERRTREYTELSKNL